VTTHYLALSGEIACKGFRIVRDDRPPEKRTYVTNYPDEVTCPECKAIQVMADKRRTG
jgi:hypothetical protein